MLGFMTQTDLPLFSVMRRNKFCEGLRQIEEMAKSDKASDAFKAAAAEYLATVNDGAKNTAASDALVAAIKDITPKGYASLDKVKESIRQTLIDEKKAELIAAEMKGKSLDELKAMENVITCQPVSDVYYKKPTFISETSADEQVISAAVAEMSEGAVSEPIKGKNGVYVIKVNAKTAKTGEFDANAEAEYIRNNRRGSGFEVENVLENAIDDNNRVHEYL